MMWSLPPPPCADGPEGQGHFLIFSLKPSLEATDRHASKLVDAAVQTSCPGLHLEGAGVASLHVEDWGLFEEGGIFFHEQGLLTEARQR